jgi:hypothetical protein
LHPNRLTTFTPPRSKLPHTGVANAYWSIWTLYKLHLSVKQSSLKTY